MTEISKLRMERAYSRIRKYAQRTPLLKGTFLDDLWQAEVYVKCEQFQPVGAFKIRGAANFALQLSEEDRKRGLLTHSSGNHAQAVAYMAHKMGITATVVMPTNSSNTKKEGAKKWGAEIIECEPTIEARITTVNKVRQEKGGVIIPPFDHEWIIEGQGTCAMEIIAEIPNIEVVAAPLGGGGLLSGTAVASEYFGREIDVIGCEPEKAADGYEGKRTGKRIEKYTPNTVADGLRTTVGEVPFPLIKEKVKDIWLAREEDILPWMYRVWKEMKVIIEPSSAVVLAAMDSNKEAIKGKKVALIITGGNVDIDKV
ncbi:MAG: threonine/serine dehydratase [Flavobacteriales bacterium]